MPSITKATMEAAIDTAIANATSNSGFLTDQEQADVLNAIIEACDYHARVLNPNVKATPNIKFRV